MKKDEILELSKKKPEDNCCIFCESKCDKCGSVNIEVIYQRHYILDDEKIIFVKSFTDVCCHDCPDSAKHSKIDIPGSLESFEFVDRPLIKKVSLGKQIDLYFEDEKSRQISSEMKERIQEEGIQYFIEEYTYENNTRNHIEMNALELHCLDEDGSYKNHEIADILGSIFQLARISFDCKTNPDNPKSHYVIEATTMTIVSNK